MEERIRRISGRSTTHTGGTYEFDIARMSSIVENIFWRREENNISRGKSPCSTRYKV